MALFLKKLRSTTLYRELCGILHSPDGNLLEATDDVTAEAQVEFLRWALQLARPKVVLETGTHKGFFGYLASNLLDGVRVHTVDKDTRCSKAVAAVNRGQSHIEYVFHARDTRSVLPTLQIDCQLAWLDGGHETDVVTSDLLNCYRCRIPYLAVDDTAYPSVATAVRYLLTHAPYQVLDNPFAQSDRRGAVLLHLQDADSTRSSRTP